MGSLLLRSPACGECKEMVNYSWFRFSFPLHLVPRHFLACFVTGTFIGIFPLHMFLPLSSSYKLNRRLAFCLLACHLFLFLWDFHLRCYKHLFAVWSPFWLLIVSHILSLHTLQFLSGFASPEKSSVSLVSWISSHLTPQKVTCLQNEAHLFICHLLGPLLCLHYHPNRSSTFSVAGKVTKICVCKFWGRVSGPLALCKTSET